MFSLICTQINGWVKNREAGDLRCHSAHYDVIVMSLQRAKLVASPNFWSHKNIPQLVRTYYKSCLRITIISTWRMIIAIDDFNKNSLMRTGSMLHGKYMCRMCCFITQLSIMYQWNEMNIIHYIQNHKVYHNRFNIITCDKFKPKMIFAIQQCHKYKHKIMLRHIYISFNIFTYINTTTWRSNISSLIC